MSQEPYIPATYIPGQDSSGQQSRSAQQQQPTGGVFIPGGQPPPPQQQHGQQQQYQQPTPGNVFIPGQQPQSGQQPYGAQPQQAYPQQHQYQQQQPSALFNPGQQPQEIFPPQQHMQSQYQQQPQQQMQAYHPGQQQVDTRAGEQGGGRPYVAVGAAAAGTAAVVGASYAAYQHYNTNDTSYQKEFQKLDADNSGYLEKNELEQMFAKWMPKKVIDAAMKMADKDKDGKVSMNEYVAIRQQLVMMGFAAAGTAAVGGAGYLAYQHHNNNGVDDDPQLQQSQYQQENQGGMPSYATMGAAVAGTAVVGGAGYMAYQHHQKNQRPPQDQRTGQAYASQQGNVPSPYESEFKRLDADSSGHLEKSELKKLFGKWVPTSILDAAMKAADADKDGKLSMQEYVAIRQQLGGAIPGL